MVVYLQVEEIFPAYTITDDSNYSIKLEVLPEHVEKMKQIIADYHRLRDWLEVTLDVNYGRLSPEWRQEILRNGPF